jgi:hypothetical protein
MSRESQDVSPLLDEPGETTGIPDRYASPPESQASRQPGLLDAGARRPIPIARLPLVLAATAVYAFIGSQTEFLGQSLLAIVILSLLFAIAASFLTMSSNTDRLDLFRVASLYFLLAFCLGPLFVPGGRNYYFESPRSGLLVQAAAMALFAYVMTAVGYHLPFFRTRPVGPAAAPKGEVQLGLVQLSLMFFVVGLVAWVGLVAGAGGIGVILFSDLNRNEFFTNRGLLFWPMLFMVSGSVLYFASQLKRGRGLRSGWPLVIAFLLLLALQGRHRAIGPLLMGFVVSHYLVRIISLPRFLAAATAGLFLLVVVGSARSPARRAEFLSNPVTGVASIASELDVHLRGLMIADVSRIPEVMVVIDKVPRRMDYDWGASLAIGLNPLLRITGLDDYQVEAVGFRLWSLARPDLPPMATGFLPSMLGEMRANFPTPMAILFFLIYGISMRLIYNRFIVNRGDPAAVALYAILGLYFVNMIEGTFGQNLFELLVVSAPVVLSRAVALAAIRRARGFEETLQS